MPDDGGTVELLEAARCARDRESYERTVLDHFDRTIGYDVALFVRDRPGLVTPGFDPAVLATYRERLQVYRDELRPFIQASIAAQGVGVDTEFFSPRELERTRYKDEVLRPMHGRTTLMGVLVFGGQPVGSIILGRSRPRPFTESDKQYLRAALPALSVAEVATQAAHSRTVKPATRVSLTARENEILDYLKLGYTNREIALACGTSFRTVRNQLSAVFAKLGVTNRTEALARSLER
jgi:DNA-binding CsgD family transcriptional regulator